MKHILILSMSPVVRHIGLTQSDDVKVQVITYDDVKAGIRGHKADMVMIPMDLPSQDDVYVALQLTVMHHGDFRERIVRY